MTKTTAILIAAGLALAGAAHAAVRDGSTVEAEVQAAEARLREASAKGDLAVLGALYDDALVDIHGSGWIYNKAESLDLLKNRVQGPPPRKVIKADRLDWKVVAYAEDAAVATGVNETYYEVPNPQDLARRAGVLTRSPEAMQHAGGRLMAPGDGVAPNPYRIRTVHLWVKREGQWKLAVAQATRIGERVQPGQ